VEDVARLLGMDRATRVRAIVDSTRPLEYWPEDWAVDVRMLLTGLLHEDLTRLVGRARRAKSQSWREVGASARALLEGGRGP
jgi:hypothetical protein